MMNEFIQSFDERVKPEIEYSNSEPSSNAMSVSEFLRLTDNAIRGFGTAVVVGEISEIKAYSHIYFKIKDDTSSVDCVMWSSSKASLNFEPKIGQSVEIIGTSSVYQKTGQFKLIVNSMRPLGLGLIMERLKALQAKLYNEGVFNIHKRPIKRFINTVGVITSTDGRVVHDIEMTIKRRNPLINILVYPAAVQGEGAAKSLISALNLANEDNRADVLIIGRGGGSFEDLLPFSDELLVRETAKSKIPIISAVGHEPDFALTDYSCDLRAATPTAAAEIVSSLTTYDLNNTLDKIMYDLDRHIHTLSDNIRMKLSYLVKTLDKTSIKTILYSRELFLRNCISKLNSSVNFRMNANSSILSKFENILSKYEGKVYISRLDSSVNDHMNAMTNSMLNKVKRLQDILEFESRCFTLDNNINNRINRLNQAIKSSVYMLEQLSVKSKLDRLESNYIKNLTSLENLNPLSVLKRGYSITFDDKGKTIDFASVKKDMMIETRLDKGSIISKVIETKENENK